MSKLKQSLDSTVLKEKFSSLLEKIDRNNTSKMIVERYYANVTSLEIAEGKLTANDAYAELKGIGVEQNKARHLVTASTINEKKTSVADQYFLQRIHILESAIKDLKAYDWMKPVGEFIRESQEFLTRNQLAILIERVIFDLEIDRNSNYYKKAIDKLVEASNSENVPFAITEGLSSEKWIPLVKRLVEHCEKIKGSVNGHNPNFRVNRVYSPVEFDETSGTYTFYSTNKVLETDGNTITESDKKPSESFSKLVSIAESAKFANKMMRLYPNPNSVVDIDFNGETPKVLINNKLVESANVESHLIAGGYLKYGEVSKSAQISHAISEGRNIKDLDFAYRVTSSVFEGLSATIFNLGENVYIQKVNRGMKENSFVLAESAEEAVRIVKEFMNYDISGSLTHLLEGEKAEAELRSKEIAKIESRIKFLIESRENLERVAKLNGVENTTKIKAAKELLESQIEEQNAELAKVTNTESVNESALEIAGGIVLGLVGLKAIGFIAKTVFGTLKLKAMKDPDKLKDLAEKIYQDAVTKSNKNPLQAGLWCNTAKSMIDKGDIKNGLDLIKTMSAIDKIDLKKVFEEEGFDLSDETPINESCTPGKEYKIKGETGWVYQGETDGVHIFNNDKGGKEPITYDDKQWEEAHKSGEISECEK
jgi:hypothetical protein